MEALAYPPHMCQMSNIKEWNDLVSYCEGKPTIIVEDNGYLIFTKKEIVDMVALHPYTAIKIFNQFRSQVKKGKKLSCDLRKSTSYPLVKAMERRGRVKIISESSWWWGDEEMMECRIKIL